MYRTLLTAALLAATTSLYAQTAPAPDADKKAQRQEMRAKAKAAHAEARKACEGKKDAEHRQCMTQQMCAKAADPAKCQERAQKRAERMKKRMEERKAEKKSS